MDGFKILKTKKIALFVGSVVAVLLLYGFWRIAFFGTTTLTLEGPHNPLNTVVSTNNKKLFPSGVDGRTYVFNGEVGSVQIRVSGPQIEPLTVETSVQRFSAISSVASVEPISEIDIARNVILPDLAPYISESRLFGDANDWLVVTLSRSGSDDDRYFYIYYFDSDKPDWQLVSDGIKTDLTSEPGRNVPIELSEYLEAVSDD